MNCRHCGAALSLPLVDLGTAPPSNAYLTEDALRVSERWYPLRVLVCGECWLVQTEDYANSTDLFTADYAYYSSFSSTWLQHAEHYVASMAGRFNLRPNSHVVEVASNDGYLLQYVRERAIPCLGIEPTAGTAQAARDRGIDVVEEFFGSELARRLAAAGKSADLIAANNVLGHVPDINDFVAGFAPLLKVNGVATFEFPHLLQLLAHNQFDTIYHEHFSYLSLTTIDRIFSVNGLRVFDVEEISTHGGSLRVFAQRAATGRHAIADNVSKLLQRELRDGLTQPQSYHAFQARAEKVKDEFTSFLIDAKRQGMRVAAYGAAAKGNTLMNFAGCRPDLIRYVVDRNPAKQGKYMPGSRIPIVSDDVLYRERPDYVVILPWNLRSEITIQLKAVRGWGGRFVVAIPELEVLA